MHCSANTDKNRRTQQSSLVFQEQVRQHFQQILRDSLSVMMTRLGMTMAYSTSKVDATLRLSTLIRTQSQISTMLLRETLFLRTLLLMRMVRLTFADKSVTENTRVSYPINHIENIVKTYFFSSSC